MINSKGRRVGGLYLKALDGRHVDGSEHATIDGPEVLLRVHQLAHVVGRPKRAVHIHIARGVGDDALNSQVSRDGGLLCVERDATIGDVDTSTAQLL